MLRKFLVMIAALSLAISPLMVEAGSKSPRVKQKMYLKNGKSTYKVKARARKLSRAHRANYDQGRYFPDDGVLRLASNKALVMNQLTGEIIFAKNTGDVTPIASVTKLMTAMVILDSGLALDEEVTISDEDVDYLKGTRSKLRVGTEISRHELLQLALIASENRAAAALGRSYPGGTTAFTRAMNAKAAQLGMTQSHFVDASGLNSDNVSTAEDLVRMVNAAYQYPVIRQITTQASYDVYPFGYSRPLNYVNTNGLVRNGTWNIGLSKTGYINEAGRCLVMQADIGGQPMIMILLDSVGKATRIGDAERVRKWVEKNQPAENSMVFEHTING